MQEALPPSPLTVVNSIWRGGCSGIVRNLYVDLIRKEDIRDRHYEQSREFSGSDVDGAAQIENLVTLSYVRELMEKLPTEHCEVLLWWQWRVFLSRSSGDP